MNIYLDSHPATEFFPWRPDLGPVFQGPIAIDIETNSIDPDRPWLVPPMVLAAATDGQSGVFLTRETLPPFLRTHSRSELIFHNPSFDLAVIDKTDSSLAIYDRVEDAMVWDTRLLHRLLTLATEGHTANQRRQSTLETCARLYLGVELPKDTQDADGDVIRTSYGKFLGQAASNIPEVYLDYLGKDVLATFGVWRQLQERIQQLLRLGAGYGFLDEAWLEEQVTRWGPLTHHVQLQAEIVLDQIHRHGMHIDTGRRDELDSQLEEQESQLLTELRAFGYLPGPGSQSALQSILKRAERESRVTLPRTSTGQISTSEVALEPLVHHHPFAAAFQRYKVVQKLRKTFLAKLTTGIIRPSYNVLVATGRTSSFGELNAQNLPKDDSVRGCFVPRPGHKFVVADYAAIELRTLAQALISQFGLNSELATQLNSGTDPHRRLAARLTGKPGDEITKEERQAAKAINFGKPGGMGNSALQCYARASFGVELSEEQVAELTGAYFEEYPEIQEFLEGDFAERGRLAARWLGLTPNDHFQRTDDSRFAEHPENVGRGDQPHEILGMMALKVFGEEEPCTRTGIPYSAHDIEYFWTKLRDRSGDLPHQWRCDVDDCRPSRELRRAIAHVVDRDGVWTLSGRLRANATWTARHNCVFQGLAADGAKLALWRLWRSGFRIVAFVHDEVVIEVPDDDLLEDHKEEIRTLMIDGMRLVTPDIEIEVEADIRSNWSSNSSYVSSSENLAQVGVS